jgi:hypothetical protein
VKGELYLGGRGLARGYLNDPVLTRERFVANPFDRRSGGLLYRTGDLARHRPDGALEFHGRADRQVKVRGYRIEPGDVEAAIDHHPAVRKCLVVPQAAENGDTDLVAYAVRDAERRSADRDGLTCELREFLRGRLPEHMIPRHFTWVDRLPLTPSGKLDRRALLAAAAPLPDSGATDTPPAEGLESQVAAIWKDVLGVGRVGVDTNFFDLGGHSLLLLRIHSRLKRELHTNLSVVDLFLHPTVRTLARAIASDGRGIGNSGLRASQ